MNIQDSPLKGGISIIHTVGDGNHQYEVDHVIKFKNEGLGCKSFARKGDKLLMINGVDLKDVAPEDFAKMLAMENPMLTIHAASRPSTPNMRPGSGGLHPVTKENTMFSFSLEMRREDDLTDMECDGCHLSDDVTKEDVNEDEDDFDNLILVTMKNTNISVIRGRGGCDGKPCDINEVVMVAESSKITQGMGNLENVKQWDNTIIENYLYHLYIRRKRKPDGVIIPKLASNPEKITIYQYKSDCVDGDFRGIPVVLNFTNSNCFLKCVNNGTNVSLNVMACDKQRLKSIKKDDEEILPFVFYMKAESSKTRRFESAVNQGWFIHTANEIELGVAVPQATGDQSFFFIIHT
ncbi:hypothetical protein UPYG_G00017690 [Umbra pygmaea]|uniref:Interleukin-1 n=1 Tax=Umbra pygmaea TaxID=75934 RepID=A0ABD0Y0X4_UMBPY